MGKQLRVTYQSLHFTSILLGQTYNRSICRGLSDHIVCVFSSTCSFGVFCYSGPTTNLSVTTTYICAASIHFPLSTLPSKILTTSKNYDIPSIPYLKHLSNKVPDDKNKSLSLTQKTISTKVWCSH